MPKRVLVRPSMAQLVKMNATAGLRGLARWINQRIRHCLARPDLQCVRNVESHPRAGPRPPRLYSRQSAAKPWPGRHSSSASTPLRRQARALRPRGPCARCAASGARGCRPRPRPCLRPDRAQASESAIPRRRHIHRRARRAPAARRASRHRRQALRRRIRRGVGRANAAGAARRPTRKPPRTRIPATVTGGPRRRRADRRIPTRPACRSG